MPWPKTEQPLRHQHRPHRLHAGHREHDGRDAAGEREQAAALHRPRQPVGAAASAGRERCRAGTRASPSHRRAVLRRDQADHVDVDEGRGGQHREQPAVGGGHEPAHAMKAGMAQHRARGRGRVGPQARGVRVAPAERLGHEAPDEEPHQRAGDRHGHHGAAPAEAGASTPPSSGPPIASTPSPDRPCDITCAPRCGSYRSRTIARAHTTAAASVAPCTAARRDQPADAGRQAGGHAGERCRARGRPAAPAAARSGRRPGPRQAVATRTRGSAPTSSAVPRSSAPPGRAPASAAPADTGRSCSGCSPSSRARASAATGAASGSRAPENAVIRQE